MKTCRSCKLPLPRRKFYRRSKGSSRLTSDCKQCTKKNIAGYAARRKAKGLLPYNTLRNRRVRHEVLTHYSGGEPRCACCGEKSYEFLAIDHVSGDGKQHRKVVGKEAIFHWLKRHGFPPGFRVLCHNCNMARGLWGYCPHDGGSRFVVPVRPCEIEKQRTIEAAQSIVTAGGYPSREKVAAIAGVSVSSVGTYRKAALKDGIWPGGEEAIARMKKHSTL